MSQNNLDVTPEDKEFPPSPWKPTPHGEWAPYDEAIKYDPALGEKLRPENNFKVVHNNLEHKVKINENGFIVVYRSSVSSKTGNGGYNDKNQAKRSNDFGRNNAITDEVVNGDCACHGIRRRRTNLKRVKIDEFKPEEGWEIDDIPTQVVGSEHYVMLSQWKVITDT